MAVRRIFGMPWIYPAAGLAVVGILIVILVTRPEHTQATLSPIDQGIGGKTEEQADRKPARKRRLKPGERYIVVNTHANRVYLRTQDKILLEAVCSTGSGDTLLDTATGRLWVFNTPRGEFTVTTKLVEPWWRKPDWAFIEEGEAPPPPSRAEERLDPAVMGDYALGFGDGYFIHGTLYERLLGVNVTHGCVRLGAEDLEKLYKQVTIGTGVYVF
jgi:L,D-transpeptidase YbiS